MENINTTLEVGINHPCGCCKLDPSDPTTPTWIALGVKDTICTEHQSVCDYCGFSLEIGGHNPRTGCSGRTAAEGGAR